MLDKSRSVLEELFLKVEDFILATTFKFWYWLGVQLEVTIEVPQPKPWVIYVDPTLYEELKAENDELKRKLDIADAFLGGQPTGPGRPNAKKLTRSEVSEIRAAHRAGTKQAELARVFDVNPATVSRIVRGQYYRKLAAA